MNKTLFCISNIVGQTRHCFADKTLFGQCDIVLQIGHCFARKTLFCLCDFVGWMRLCFGDETLLHGSDGRGAPPQGAIGSGEDLYTPTPPLTKTKGVSKKRESK